MKSTPDSISAVVAEMRGNDPQEAHFRAALDTTYLKGGVAEMGRAEMARKWSAP